MYNCPFSKRTLYTASTSRNLLSGNEQWACRFSKTPATLPNLKTDKREFFGAEV